MGGERLVRKCGLLEAARFVACERVVEYKSSQAYRLIFCGEYLVVQSEAFFLQRKKAI